MLRQWLQAQKIDTTEKSMLQLWKGLFYCMWMSDKPLVQEELAHNLAGLALTMSSDEVANLFLRCFFITIEREWHGIDHLRCAWSCNSAHPRSYSSLTLSLFCFHLVPYIQRKQILRPNNTDAHCFIAAGQALRLVRRASGLRHDITRPGAVAAAGRLQGKGRRYITAYVQLGRSPHPFMHAALFFSLSFV